MTTSCSRLLTNVINSHLTEQFISIQMTIDKIYPRPQWKCFSEKFPFGKNAEGINYIWARKNGIYFVCTARFNVSPTVTVELINRIIQLFADYCGKLTEQDLRENYLLLYEVLDEVDDFGYPQDSSAEVLKNHVFNTSGSLWDTISPTGGPVSDISIVNSNAKDKNELFVDVVERLHCTFNSNGDIIMSSIDGQINIKSFLQENPVVTLTLDPNIIVGRQKAAEAGGGIGHIILDDANLHECIDSHQFEESKMLVFYPPDGEFTAMYYRITSPYNPPFMIYPMIDQEIDTKVELIVKIVGSYPKEMYANNVGLTFNAPASTLTCTTNLPDGVTGETCDYREKEKKVIWQIEKCDGQSEHLLRVVFSLDSPASAHIRKEIGPLICTFAIPGVMTSPLKIIKCEVEDKTPKNKAKKWLRRLTTNSSYVCRI